MLTIVDRAGAAQAHGLPDRGAKSLVAVLGGRVGADAVLCQDGARTGTGTTLFAPRRRARSRAMPHYRLDTKTGPRVIQKTCHIQTVTSLHSRGETFMRPSCGPATKHLPGYTAWFIARRSGAEPTAQSETWRQLLAALQTRNADTAISITKSDRTLASAVIRQRPFSHKSREQLAQQPPNAFSR